jgi:hypothetical protein
VRQAAAALGSARGVGGGERRGGVEHDVAGGTARHGDGHFASVVQDARACRQHDLLPPYGYASRLETTTVSQEAAERDFSNR